MHDYRVEFYFIILIMILTAFSPASMSKVFVGNEDGQIILGAESLAVNVDGLFGGELKFAFRKSGVIVDGVEYGSQPARTSISLIAGGASELNVAKYRNTLAYIHDEPIKFKMDQEFQIISGAGPYLIYQ